MSNFLDLIRSSKDLLDKCLELYDSLETEFLREVLTNEDKNEKLIEMNQKITKLKINIKDAEDVHLKPKSMSEGIYKKQNGDTKDILISMGDIICDTIINNHIVDGALEVTNALTNISKNGIESELSDGECSSQGDEETLILGDFNGISKVIEKDIDDSIEAADVSDDDCSVKLIVDETVYNSDIANKSECAGSQFLATSDINSVLQLTSKQTSEVDNAIANGIKDCCILLPSSSIVIEIDSDEMVVDGHSDAAMDKDGARVATMFSVRLDSIKQNKDTIMMKECYVVLEDISLGEKKIIFDADSYDDMKKGVEKLSKIPKRTHKRSKKINKANGKKRCKLIRNKITKAPKSGSEENDSVVSCRSVHLDITNTDMIDSPPSNNESESSTNNLKTRRKLVKRKNSRPSEYLVQRRITRSLMIPLMSDSDTSLKAKKKSKKASKGTNKVVCLSSTSEDESEAHESNVRQGERDKRKKDVKSGSNGKKRKIDSDEDEGIEEASDDGTRKNSQKIIKKDRLSEAKKAAEMLEKERRERIEEKQELYNRAMNINEASNTENISSLVLEKDQSGESIVEVHQHIAEKLKGHQIDAVQFMYDCVIESVLCLQKSQEKDEGDMKSSSAAGGCILAHCMGLGKTLSLIAFMHTMLTSPSLSLYTCIIVCPVNTALDWKREWKTWMPTDRPVKIFDVSGNESKSSKMSVVQNWCKKGGVLIIGYAMFRLLSLGEFRTIRNKVTRDKMYEALIDPGADFIVCDEGHLLKNEKAAITKVVNEIKTNRRIILTGAILQNRLLEYHTMVNFVKPNLIGTQKEFMNRFVHPISNGQHINSTASDVQVMKKRSHVLFKTLDGCVHRRDFSALFKYLPTKYEYVIKVRMSDIQRELYTKYLSMVQQSRQSVFQDQASLARIWTHPFMLYMHQEIEDKKAFFIESEDESLSNESCHGGDNVRKQRTYSKGPLRADNIINLISDESQNEADEVAMKEIKKEPTRKNGDEIFSDSSVEEVVKEGKASKEVIVEGSFEIEGLEDTVSETHWWSEIMKPEHEHRIDLSGKLTVLFHILHKAAEIGDKVVVFTQSLAVLDTIEKYLVELHAISATAGAEGDGGATGYNTWLKGLDYERMNDKSHVGEDTQSRFNADSRLRLFLITTGIGGAGLNLVAANRVVIFDVSWTQSNDIQAIFRSYRFGQEKPVYVYRLVSQGTMEERMYERQVTELSLSPRVVNEQQTSRYFTEEDLRSLYKFAPAVYDPEKNSVATILPKDRFLAELITTFPNWIYGYHEHDSLVQIKAEEELTEAEVHEAWKEFDEEKVNGPQHVIRDVQEHSDSNKLVESQVRKMTQQYPQYSALYAQNYSNLRTYALGQQPALEYSPVQLNARMQVIFITSLQKHISSRHTVAPPKCNGPSEPIL